MQTISLLKVNNRQTLKQKHTRVQAISITKKSCELALRLPNGLSSLRSLEVMRLQAEDDHFAFVL